MLSANTLKHNITVHTSIYSGVVVFILYFLLIVLSVFIMGVSWPTFPFLIILLAVAVYAGKKASAQSYQLKLSDSGGLEAGFINGCVVNALISSSSFYNGFFLCLRLQNNPANILPPANKENIRKACIIIYRDAVSEAEYRLLARLINTGR